MTRVRADYYYYFLEIDIDLSDKIYFPCPLQAHNICEYSIIPQLNREHPDWGGAKGEALVGIMPTSAIK